MGRSHSIQRCPNCGLAGLFCICEDIRKMKGNLGTQALPLSFERTLIIAHYREKVLTSSSAKLFKLFYPELYQLIWRGLKGNTSQQELAEFRKQTNPTSQVAYFYPDPEARPWEEVVHEFPLAKWTLIFPDGTWNQTNKIFKREKLSEHFPKIHRVYIKNETFSTYGLRHSDRPNALCTFEAILAAIHQLGATSGVAALRAAFQMWRDRVLFLRGTIAQADVFGGVDIKMIDSLNGVTDIQRELLKFKKS